RVPQRLRRAGTRRGPPRRRRRRGPRGRRRRPLADPDQRLQPGPPRRQSAGRDRGDRRPAASGRPLGRRRSRPHHGTRRHEEGLRRLRGPVPLPGDPEDRPRQPTDRGRRAGGGERGLHRPEERRGAHHLRGLRQRAGADADRVRDRRRHRRLGAREHPRHRRRNWPMNLTRVRWLLAAALAAGCGGRGPFWESPIASQPLTFDLGTEVALVDQPADRVVLLSVVNSPGPSPNGQRPNLTATTVPLGSNVLNAATSADGKKLFVVSGGRRAELGDDQPTEPPSVTVIDADTAAPQRYDLTDITDPLAGLAIDPGGHWLVLYPSNDANQPFVENPNELVVLDVSQPPPPSPAGAATIPHTLKSFGGHPQR